MKLQTLPEPKVKRVWIELSEFGEIVCYYPNMKAIYKYLSEQQLWIDKVNYSYFSRVLNKENNNRNWTFYTKDNYKLNRRFYPVRCGVK